MPLPPPQGWGTAVAEDVMAPATFTAGAGTFAVGSLPTETQNVTASGLEAVPIPKGYYNGSVAVNQVDVPADAVLSTVTIAGVTGTIPSISGGTTITPTTETQTAVASGTYVQDTITVGAVDVPVADVLSGTVIAGATGTMPNNGSATVTPNGDTQTLASGYYSGVTVNPVSVQLATGTVTASTSTDTFVYTDSSTTTSYYLSIPVPSGATQIIAVQAGGQFSSGSATETDILAATPNGWAGGSTANAVAALGGGSGISLFASGGALALSTSGITLPWPVSGTALAGSTATYVVYYV